MDWYLVHLEEWVGDEDVAKHNVLIKVEASSYLEAEELAVMGDRMWYDVVNIWCTGPTEPQPLPANKWKEIINEL